MKNDFIDFPLFVIPEAEPKHCSGDNREQVLVVFQATTDLEALKTFLGNVLEAVQLNIQKDITLISLTPGETFSLSRLRKRLPVGKAIVFGLPPSAIGLQCPELRYRLLAFHGMTCLFADELETIYRERQQGGKRLSTALWRSLKTLFPREH